MTRHLRALGEEVEAPIGVVLEGGYALPGALCLGGGDDGRRSRATSRLRWRRPTFSPGRAASYIGHHWTL